MLCLQPGTSGNIPRHSLGSAKPPPPSTMPGKKDIPHMEKELRVKACCLRKQPKKVAMSPFPNPAPEQRLQIPPKP